MDDDDDDAPPYWLARAWAISSACTAAVQAAPHRALRIAPVRPSRRPVVDKVLWVWGHAPDTDLFRVQHPGIDVPAGARFAFAVGKGIGHTEVAHLRDCRLAGAFKLQVLELAPGYIVAGRQVLFHDAKVVVEFELS
jgi:hypothetical protein